MATTKKNAEKATTTKVATQKPATQKPADKQKTPKPVAEKKTEKPVEKKVKVSLKDISAQVEANFKTNTVVDVIADTRLDEPTGISYDDYKFVHFRNKGTTKDMFQLYLGGKKSKFILTAKVSDFLDKELDITPSEKKQKNGEKKVVYVIVKCPTENVSDVAKKIIEAFNKIPQTTAKEEKKETKKEA